jgi:outer membrane protein
MKKYFLLLIALVAISFSSNAQKFAYVDSEYILGNITEYNEAQTKLDDISKGWQKEIETKYKEIDQMYKNYQQEQVLLTEEMKQNRQKEIEDKEKSAKELQKKYFGFEGELFKKRQELVKPIQDKVYDAIAKVATTKAYDFVFDKSSGAVMLYTNAKFDISDDVVKQLGYTPKPK